MPGMIGVDGCRGGWFAVSDTECRVYPRFADLAAANPDATYYVDMPMGLMLDQPRTLESSARQLLRGKASSVFSVPCREAVYANNYGQACAINERRFGKRISIQAWNICSKIRELDEFLRKNPDSNEQIFESHPELAFHRINGKPLRFSKKSPEGIAERLSILSAHLPEARAWFEAALNTYRRSVLARDDIVDAIVLCVVARLPQTILWDEKKQDEEGILVRMVLPD